MKSREQVTELLTGLLVDMFEVAPEAVVSNARLYEDLDVDSIDAVDLIVELRNITGKQIDPDVFKSVRTVDDVVAAVMDIIEAE